MYNLMLPINTTSYGIVGYNVAKNWDEDFSLFPIYSLKDIYVEKDAETDFIKRAITNADNWDYNKPCLKLWHQHSMELFPKSSKRVGFPIFELDEFTKKEKNNLLSLDKIIVTSQWAKDVIHSHALLQSCDVEVVNLGTDTSLFNDKWDNKKNGPYTFLNIGKLEKRKGHDVLIEIFNRAFSPQDDVLLVVYWENHFLDKNVHERYQELYKASKMGHRIMFMPRVPKQADVANIIKSADAYISPSRAEGWNMPLYDAIACNKPVITTNCTAHTEYCNKNNSFLVDSFETEIAHDGAFFKDYIGSWHKITDKQIDDFAQYMRHCYKNNIIRMQKTEINSWKQVSQNLQNCLKNI
jgi:glycosyltransferase involved in cell wall biosynthesis